MTMKKIKQLDDYDNSKHVDESAGITSIKNQKGSGQEKVKFRFEVSDNLKKVSKIEKTLIDTSILLVDMADEIVALKMNFPNMDPDSMKLMNNMAYNLKNMIDSLKLEDKRGGKTGMLDNVGRLYRNMEKLKHDFINKK